MVINVLCKSDCISINSWQREFDSINSLCESLNIILNESNEEDSNDKRNKIKNTIKIIIGKIKTMYDNFISDYAYPFIIKCQKDFISKNIDSKEMKKIIDSFDQEFTINTSKYISYETFKDYEENVIKNNEYGMFSGITTKNGNNDKDSNFISITGIMLHEKFKKNKDQQIKETNYIPKFYERLISNGEYKVNKEVINNAYSTIFDNNNFINRIKNIKDILIKTLNQSLQKDNDNKNKIVSPNEVWSGINVYIQGMFKIYSLYLQTCMKVLKATIKKYGSQNTKED